MERESHLARRNLGTSLFPEHVGVKENRKMLLCKTSGGGTEICEIKNKNAAGGEDSNFGESGLGSSRQRGPRKLARLTAADQDCDWENPGLVLGLGDAGRLILRVAPVSFADFSCAEAALLYVIGKIHSHLVKHFVGSYSGPDLLRTFSRRLSSRAAVSGLNLGDTTFGYACFIGSGKIRASCWR